MYDNDKSLPKEYKQMIVFISFRCTECDWGSIVRHDYAVSLTKLNAMYYYGGLETF